MVPNLKRYREVIFTSLLDFLILNGVWVFFYFLYEDELFILSGGYEARFIWVGLSLSCFWLGCLILFGSYKKLYLISRLDELLSVSKSMVFGSLLLFFLISLLAQPNIEALPLLVGVYGLMALSTIAVSRFLIRTMQRYNAIRGKGLHRTLIIGTGNSAKVAHDDLVRNKTLGMEVMGFIQVNGKAPDGSTGILQEQVIGHLDNIRKIIDEYEIQEVLVALDADRKDDLVDVISKVDYQDVTLKLLPDFHELVSGLNKTNQIFGLPLVEVSPEPMPLWEKTSKRVLDILVSVLALTLLFPFMLIIAIVIRVTSAGPAIFKQVRVGRAEKPFTILKFRTMYENAEALTGPTWAKENDSRVTPIGYWLRKMRLDELPQFLNVLKGDMSLVGPRPERPHFVEKYARQIPLYKRRHRVRPGITGWAQIKWKYGGSLDTVREKTKYDLFYIENISLKMDAKILINTIITMIKGKGL